MTSEGICIYPGLESGTLTATSSSVNDAAHAAFRCQFGIEIREGSDTWCAAVNDRNQYLQLSSPIVFMVHKIITRGRKDSDQWVTTYLLSYTLNGADWINYNESQVFIGNSDRTTRVEHELTPFIARAVRIRPLTFVGHISMKAELLISDAPEIYQRICNNQLIPAIEIGMPVHVSSVYDASYDATRIRINYSGNREGGCSWIAAASNLNQWVTVSTIIPKEWCKISLQGRGNSSQYVTKFCISFTRNGRDWHLYNNGEKLNGNSNDTSVVHIDLTPFIARSIKFLPVEWNSYISMRLETYFRDF